MNSIPHIVQARLSAVQQFMCSVKLATQPYGLQKVLSTDQEQELISCALFKICVCFLELAQLSLSNIQLSSNQKTSIDAKIASNAALLSKLYTQIRAEIIPKKNQATKQTKVKTLRAKFAELNIRIPKAPVSAFYLSKNQPKRNFSTEWSNMQSFEKQPYQLLATDIHQDYHKSMNLKHHDSQKQTKVEKIRKSSLKRTANKPDKIEQAQQKRSSWKEKQNRQSVTEQSNQDILSDSQAEMIEQPSLQQFQKGLKVRDKEVGDKDLEDKQRESQFNCAQVQI